MTKTLELTCNLCGAGFEMKQDSYYKRVKRGMADPNRCENCFKPKNKKKSSTACIIHTGELNLDTLLPVDKEGNHILYGYRLCDNRECINPKHVTTNIRLARNKGLRPTPLFHKRHDITGEELAKLARQVEPGTQKPNTCSVPDCIKPARALTLCNGHHLKFTRWRKANGITQKRISLNNAEMFKYALPTIGVNDFKPKDRYCHVPNCNNEYQARGLCKKHYHRLLRAIKDAECGRTY